MTTMMMMSWLMMCECVAGAWRRSQSAHERLRDKLDGVTDQSSRHVTQHAAQGRPARVQGGQVSLLLPQFLREDVVKVKVNVDLYSASSWSHL